MKATSYQYIKQIMPYLDMLLILVLSELFSLYRGYELILYSLILFSILHSQFVFMNRVSKIKTGIYSLYLVFRFNWYSIPIILFMIVFTMNMERQKQSNIKDEIQEMIWNITDDIVFVKDKDLRYVKVNSALEKFFKKEKNQILGKTDFEAFPNEAKYYNDGDKRVLASKESETTYETSVLNGIERSMMTIKQPIIDKQGDVIGIFGIARDISVLDRVSKELEESNELLERIFEFAPDPIFLKSLDGKYLKVNAAFAKIHDMKIEEIQGLRDEELFDAVIAEKFKITDREVLEKGKPVINQTTTKINNNIITTVATKSPLVNSKGEISGIIGVVHDISNLTNLENKIIETQKMDSVTNLAAGVAHDLNNILTGVLGYGSVLKEIEENEEKLEFVDNIISATKQATELINKLMLFTNQSRSVESSQIDINEVVENTYKIIQPSISKNIKFSFDLSDLPAVSGDVTQINQIILNLLINAVEAIEVDGEIAISTSVERIHEFSSFRYLSPSISPGQFIKFKISDTGTGIPQDIQNRIFEPFFSTKSHTRSKKGTGLGLAIVYGVVTKHGGLINLESEVGKGTLIEIYLPAGGTLENPLKPAEKLIQGDGTILCIDDEDSIHVLLKNMLPKLGFTIISAYNGMEGIELFQKHKNALVGVILDLTMPEMNGKEVFQKIKSIDSGVKVILSTGYGKQVDLDSLKAEGILHVLPKPYTIYELSAILAKIY
ncbi:MAG: PAS domain-containing protein [Candidatus Heimdallarchaeota archaeon]|nr:PAS domain-containing protein [Candidatus Heimdallarchaeota archaeon]